MSIPHGLRENKDYQSNMAPSEDKPMDFHVEELRKLHEEYQRSVPNKYEATLDRLATALPAKNAAGVASALSDWLGNINMQYYRFRPVKRKSLQGDLERLIARQLEILLAFRLRNIASLTEADGPDVSQLFGVLREKLGPVGAAKALHVLAPNMFPLWDSAIAQAAGVSKERGYFQFMQIRREQVVSLPSGLPKDVSPLKLLDEVDYLRHTAKRNAVQRSG